MFVFLWQDSTPRTVDEIVSAVKVIADLGFDEGLAALGLPNPRCEEDSVASCSAAGCWAGHDRLCSCSTLFLPGDVCPGCS